MVELPAAADDERQFTFHAYMDTHVRFKNLTVVYTNDSVWVENSIYTMEQLLAFDKCKVVGFDPEYTGLSIAPTTYSVLWTPPTKKRCSRPWAWPAGILWTSNASKKFLGGKEKHKDSLVDLAMAIIDPYYTDMKDVCKKYKFAWHRAWVRRLDEDHVKYAAKDAYISYET
ncbi:hypothetical protein D1007_07266 [Hordeum vulgare]|nr:hypothetical protein D1007_07266 [Hordeum vulgare]